MSVLHLLLPRVQTTGRADMIRKVAARNGGASFEKFHSREMATGDSFDASLKVRGRNRLRIAANLGVFGFSRRSTSRRERCPGDGAR